MREREREREREKFSIIALSVSPGFFSENVEVVYSFSVGVPVVISSYYLTCVTMVLVEVFFFVVRFFVFSLGNLLTVICHFCP